jgi:hypothetical protein
MNPLESRDSIQKPLNEAASLPNQQFIESISFESYLDEKSEGKTASRFIQVAEQTYKVVDDPTNLLDSQQKSDDAKVQKAFESSSSASVTVQDETDAPQQQDTAQNQGVHSGVLVNLIPVNTQAFIAELPQSLRGFIEETVSVIKTKNLLTQESQFLFRFEKLNLEITIRNIDHKLVIDVKVEDESLKQSLFSDDNKALLFSALQQELQKQDIELNFIDTLAAESETQSDGEHGSDSSREETDEQDDD